MIILNYIIVDYAYFIIIILYYCMTESCTHSTHTHSFILVILFMIIIIIILYYCMTESCSHATHQHTKQVLFPLTRY
jgi:Kef-type K+ transport system membrane component KefB